MFGTKGFARGIAKAQLRSFLSYRAAYPSMKPQELYLATLKTRRQHSEELIIKWIKESSNLQDVVICMAQYEFLLQGRDVGYKDFITIDETVKAVIPANL